MGTSLVSNQNQKRANEPALEELNARLDHINSRVHPITPFILTIPSKRPIEFSEDYQRQFWVKGTLFAFEEGQLQYISNFSDWGQGLIRPVGGWDDGKGGIANHDPAPQSAPMTPQPPVKKIKLGEYARKRATGSDRSSNAVSSPAQNGSERRKTPDANRPRSRDNVRTNARERTVDESSTSMSVTVQSFTPARRSHESMLPEDDLPPPMTPLPPKLAAAVAEYREHLKTSACAVKVIATQDSAARAHKLYEKRLESLAETTNGTSATGSLIITRRFNKKATEYRKLAQGFDSEASRSLGSPHRLSSQSVVKLKQLSDDLYRKAKSRERNDDQDIQLRLEALMCAILYAKLGKCAKPNARKQWEDLLLILEEFAGCYLTKENEDFLPGGEKDQDLIRHIVDTLMCLVHRELALQHDPRRDPVSGIAVWLRSEAFAYAVRASNLLGPKKIAARYPKIWEDSSDTHLGVEADDQRDWMTVILTGPYSFPLAEGSVLEGVRGVRRLLLRYSHDIGQEWPDNLGTFALKIDAVT